MDLPRSTVAQLKQRLREAGLPTSGRKADLVTRLASATATNPPPSPANPAAPRRATYRPLTKDPAPQQPPQQQPKKPKTEAGEAASSAAGTAAYTGTGCASSSGAGPAPAPTSHRSARAAAAEEGVDDIDNEAGEDLLLGCFDTKIVGVQHYVRNPTRTPWLMPEFTTTCRAWLVWVAGRP